MCVQRRRPGSRRSLRYGHRDDDQAVGVVAQRTIINDQNEGFREPLTDRGGERRWHEYVRTRVKKRHWTSPWIRNRRCLVLGRTKRYHRMPSRADGASARLTRNLQCNQRNHQDPIGPKSGRNSSRPLIREALKSFSSHRFLLPLPMVMKAASMIWQRTVE